MKKVNALGLSCPLPVVMAKKALKELGDSGTVVVSVDSAMSAENLEKLAKKLKCDFKINKLSENRFDIEITKNGGGGLDASSESDAAESDTVVVIAGAQMGEGDPELGRSLMKAFIYALTEADDIPSKIILYNGGATLNVHGSPVCDDIKALEKKGCAVFTCGACLNHYGLTERLACGEITNMYAILEMMSSAGKIIRP